MYCKSLHTQKQHTKVDRCGIMKQMLELKVVRQTTMETQGFISRSSDSPPWILRLRWETHWVWVSFNSIHWVGSLSTISSIPLSWSFPPRGQDHARTNLPLLTTPSGASQRHQPSRRLTSKSNKCKLRSLMEPRVLKLWLLSAARNTALTMVTLLTHTLNLSTQSKDMQSI